jgi:diaminopimelate decarboxylase
MRLRSIHFHLGTQTQDVEKYCEMVQVARKLWDAYRFDDNVCLDIGGGFPYDHDRQFDEQQFRPPHFFSTLATAWGIGQRPSLIVEPGRYIAAPSMAVVSRVISRKPRSGEPTIVVLDSGTNHNVMAAFFEHLWSFVGISPEAEYRFCGPLCMEDDILSGRRYSALPARGDLVATLNAGAYSLALMRAFIQPLPPVFEVREDGNYEKLERYRPLVAVDGLDPD